jgi:hypothetical protein
MDGEAELDRVTVLFDHEKVGKAEREPPSWYWEVKAFVEDTGLGLRSPPLEVLTGWP